MLGLFYQVAWLGEGTSTKRGDDRPDWCGDDDLKRGERADRPDRPQRIAVRHSAGDRADDDEGQGRADGRGDESGRDPRSSQPVADLDRTHAPEDQRPGLGDGVRDRRRVRGRVNIGREPRADRAAPIGAAVLGEPPLIDGRQLLERRDEGVERRRPHEPEAARGAQPRQARVAHERREAKAWSSSP